MLMGGFLLWAPPVFSQTSKLEISATYSDSRNAEANVASESNETTISSGYGILWATAALYFSSTTTHTQSDYESENATGFTYEADAMETIEQNTFIITLEDWVFELFNEREIDKVQQRTSENTNYEQRVETQIPYLVGLGSRWHSIVLIVRGGHFKKKFKLDYLDTILGDELYEGDFYGYGINNIYRGPQSQQGLFFEFALDKRIFPAVSGDIVDLKAGFQEFGGFSLGYGFKGGLLKLDYGQTRKSFEIKDTLSSMETIQKQGIVMSVDAFSIKVFERVSLKTTEFLEQETAKISKTSGFALSFTILF